LNDPPKKNTRKKRILAVGDSNNKSHFLHLFFKVLTIMVYTPGHSTEDHQLAIPCHCCVLEAQEKEVPLKASVFKR
jgi:hypothetical protein